LKALHFDGEEEVNGPDGDKMPIRLALLREYQIRAPHRDFPNAMADHDAADQYLKELISSDVRTELDKFLWAAKSSIFLSNRPGSASLRPNSFQCFKNCSRVFIRLHLV
jgi:hypothetical protein